MQIILTRWLILGIDGNQTILVLKSCPEHNKHNQWTTALKLIARFTVNWWIGYKQYIHQ